MVKNTHHTTKGKAKAKYGRERVRPKIPFLTWILYGANIKAAQTIFWRNHIPNEKAGEAPVLDMPAFLDELENHLEADNVGFYHDILELWVAKFTRNPEGIVWD